MYLNTYNYFQYLWYNKMVKSNEPLIIKSVRSAMHSLLTLFVHTTLFFKDASKNLFPVSDSTLQYC